jgi:hypothetical protein
MDISVLMLEIQKMSKIIEVIPDMYNRISTIQTDVSEMKTDIIDLKTRVSTIETRVSLIETRLSTIETRVSTIETHVSLIETRVSTIESNMSTFTKAKNFISYTRQDTAIQEITNEKLVFDYLTRKIPTSVFEMRKRFDFVDITGNRITDLDGCILMNVQKYNPLLIDDRVSSISFTLKDDSKLISQRHLQQATIFIESKRTLDIPKMNTKIRQLLQMTKILNLLPTLNLSTTHEKFTKMVNEHNLYEFPKHVIMIFASNNISLPLKDLILEINNDTLTENKYYNYIFDALKGDIFYDELKKDDRITEQSKLNLEQYISSQNVDAIRDACRASEYSTRSQNLLSYFPVYTTIRSLYTQVKGKLGVLFIQDIIVPGLIPMSCTLELVGGSRLRHTTTIKRRASKRY